MASQLRDLRTEMLAGGGVEGLDAPQLGIARQDGRKGFNLPRRARDRFRRNPGVRGATAGRPKRAFRVHPLSTPFGERG